MSDTATVHTLETSTLYTPEKIRLAALNCSPNNRISGSEARREDHQAWADRFMARLAEIGKGKPVCRHCGEDEKGDLYRCTACQKWHCDNCDGGVEDWSDEHRAFCEDCASLCECVESIYCFGCRVKHPGKAGLIDTAPCRVRDRHDSSNDPGDQWDECSKCDGTPGVELTHAARVELERDKAADVQSEADVMREAMERR